MTDLAFEATCSPTPSEKGISVTFDMGSVLAHDFKDQTSFSYSLPLRSNLEYETSSADVIPFKGGINHGKEVRELKRLSGLTWDKLAEIFGTSRRSLHLWANDESISIENINKLIAVLKTVSVINLGRPSLNKRFLLLKNESGSTGLELLKRGDYPDLIEISKGYLKVNLPSQESRRLSNEESKMRHPHPPSDLLSERGDEIKIEAKKAKKAKKAKPLRKKK